MFKKRILLVMPLIMVLAAIAFIGTGANGKSSLTDAQMSSVYGGHVFETENNDACAQLWTWGDCSGSSDDRVPDPWPGGSGGCLGNWRTTCGQNEKYCEETSPNLGCVYDDDLDCTNTYKTGSCDLVGETCIVTSSGSFDCMNRSPNQRRDAHNTL